MEAAEESEETASSVSISLLELAFLGLLQFNHPKAVSFAIIHCLVIELGFRSLLIDEAIQILC